MAISYTSDYSGSEIDAAIAKVQSMDNVFATIAFVNGAVNSVAPPSGENYATQTYVENNDKKVRQNYSVENNNFPLLISAVAGTSSTTERGLAEAIVNNSLYANPATGTLYGNKVYGAVYNDYAEFREAKEPIEAGRCAVEVGDDTMRASTERLTPGAALVSDTFGFCIGEAEGVAIPVAVSGRILAYPYEDREEFRKAIGRPVCSAPNGCVSIMSDEEYKEKGYCTIGFVSSVPNYDTWGSENVDVKGRVWIKVV